MASKKSKKENREIFTDKEMKKICEKKMKRFLTKGMELHLNNICLEAAAETNKTFLEWKNKILNEIKKEMFIAVSQVL